MKRTLTLLAVGTGLLIGLPSCQSSNSATGGYEEAMPMSELSVADGELPPWVLESDDADVQVSAGDVARNQYAIPEPEHTVADRGSSVSTSQNQPKHTDIASAQDDTVLENEFAPAAPAITHEHVAATTPKPAAPKPVATTTGKKSGKSGTKTASTKKPKGERVSKPTLVVYKVRPGDNLSDIAKRSHTTVAQIKKDSGIKSDVIHPGQVIKVRFTPKGYKAPSKGSSGAPKVSSYTVRSGDTISGIAKKHGVSAAALLAANGLSAKDAAKIRPGRKLSIPAAGSSAKSSKSTKSAKSSKSGKKKTTRKR
ncbi:MAG: LysM peptidoglycan-binding domain-containing protein [Akkermansia sp.]